MDGDTLYIPVFDSQDVISVPIGPNHAADPEEASACCVRQQSQRSADTRRQLHCSRSMTRRCVQALAARTCLMVRVVRL